MKTLLPLMIATVMFATAFAAEVKPDTQAGENYVAIVKHKKDANTILESPDFKDCKDKNKDIADDEERSNKIRECFALKLDNISNDDDVKKIAENIELNNFNVEAAKSATSIKNYLKDRLDEALYGSKLDDPKAAAKIKKHVGMDVYFKLYKTQIGKNIIMETSAYCLENLRGPDKKLITFNCLNGNSGCVNNGVVVGPDGVFDLKYWLSKATEEEYTPEMRQKIDQYVDQEMKKGKEYLSTKMSHICMVAVPFMCKRYECNNAASRDNKECQELFQSVGLTWTPAPDPSAQAGKPTDIKLAEKDENGRIACTLQTKIKEYRKAIVAVDETLDKMKQLNGGGAYEMRMGFESEYQFGQGANEKSIDQITNVSSKEIVNNEKIAEFKDADKEAENLKKECGEGKATEECRALAADKKDLASIAVEFEASTALEVKKLQNLKNNKEDLKKYLQENGLEEYAENIQGLSDEQLAQMIADKYKAQRMAVLNRLKAQLNPKPKTDENDKKDAKAEANKLKEAARLAAEEVKDADDRVGSLIHYNNVISSFLELKQKDGDREKVIATNTGALSAEQDGLKNFGNKEDQEKSKYLSDLAGDSQGSNTSSGTSGVPDFNYMELVNGLLGIQKKEKQANN